MSTHSWSVWLGGGSTHSWSVWLGGGGGVNTQLVGVVGGGGQHTVGRCGWGVNTQLVGVAVGVGVNTELVGVAGYTDGQTNRHIYTHALTQTHSHAPHCVAVHNLFDANLIILYVYHPCVCSN